MNTPIVASPNVVHDAFPVCIPVAGCLLLCNQCEVIALSLTDEQYGARVAGKASIGQHLRHCAEHFSLLLEGLDRGKIDYDARKRDTELETCTTFFVATIRNIAIQLKCLGEVPMSKPLQVRMLFAANAEPVNVASTLGRELGFVSSHAIHHIAMVKMLAFSLGASLPEEYGEGVATMLHRAASAGIHSRA